jgi:hypothetical protein
LQTGLNKFKDEIPIYSITRIRNILHDLGLLTVEQWHNSLEGICSLRLNIAGTGVGQNGKGVTPEYAWPAPTASLWKDFRAGICTTKQPWTRRF